MALISKRMPERKRIVRFEIVFSHIPFLLRLSQITEPEPEPYPRPPRIRLKIPRGFRTFSDRVSSHTNPDLSLISHTEYRYHSRTRMASNYGSDIVDQYIVNTHFLADKFCHIFCIFNTIPMCDHDNIIIPAL